MAITGRDEMLEGHAMVIALPFLLLHSVDTSNIYDLMRVMETKKKLMPMSRGHLQAEVFAMLQRLKDGQTSPQNWKEQSGKDGMLEALIETYLNNLDRYMPADWVKDWNRRLVAQAAD